MPDPERILRRMKVKMVFTLEDDGNDPVILYEDYIEGVKPTVEADTATVAIDAMIDLSEEAAERFRDDIFTIDDVYEAMYGLPDTD
jgi:hypothetical protein